MPGAQSSPTGKVLNAQILSRIRGDPTLHFLQRRPANGSRFAFTTELHLSSRSFEEHNQLRCYSHGYLSPQILFHKRQR
jgi:hypothetical protein